jgi:hypothetical protein
VGGEKLGAGPTNAARRAGDDCYLSFQQLHRFVSFLKTISGIYRRNCQREIPLPRSLHYSHLLFKQGVNEKSLEKER